MYVSKDNDTMMPTLKGNHWGRGPFVIWRIGVSTVNAFSLAQSVTRIESQNAV